MTKDRFVISVGVSKVLDISFLLADSPSLEEPALGKARLTTGSVEY